MKETQTLDDIKPLDQLRRRSLLPTWIKIFLWIFMVFGAMVPIGLICGALDVDIDLALYGLETTQALSLIGLTVIALFGLKGAVSFGLWMEKDWAVRLAMIDAIIGIVICAVVMFVLPFLGNSGGLLFNFRLELALLIPYLIKMKKIQAAWEGILHTEA